MAATINAITSRFITEKFRSEPIKPLPLIDWSLLMPGTGAEGRHENFQAHNVGS